MAAAGVCLGEIRGNKRGRRATDGGLTVFSKTSAPRGLVISAGRVLQGPPGSSRVQDLENKS